MALRCPRDHADLVGERYEGFVTVDRCPTCHGVWLDRTELSAVQETFEHDYSKALARIPDDVARAYEFARQKGRSAPDCPRCRAPLTPEEYAYCSLILIDRCGTCGGIWLDSGELEALEQFFERETGRHDQIRKGFFASLADRLLS